MVKKPICSCCGKEKNLGDYYASVSPFHQITEKLPVCKQCIWDYVETDRDNVEFIKSILRMLDKPFIETLWDSSTEESTSSGGDKFKKYMKNLALKDFRNRTWADSVYSTREIVLGETKQVENIQQDELEELVHYWGEGFTVEEYFWLQNEYEDFLNRYECDSKGMETLIQQICLTKLDIRKGRASKQKVDAQLKTLQDLLGSSNLKPVQETGANAAEQESFGTLLKKYENERPVPEADPKWKDVDRIGKYIRVFFFGHLARMLGIKNDHADEYWEEVNQFTVEEPVEEESEELEYGRD